MRRETWGQGVCSVLVWARNADACHTGRWNVSLLLHIHHNNEKGTLGPGSVQVHAIQAVGMCCFHSMNTTTMEGKSVGREYA
eukprot:1158883-Pelagomonas_calceolata.AAC.16